VKTSRNRDGQFFESEVRGNAAPLLLSYEDVYTGNINSKIRDTKTGSLYESAANMKSYQRRAAAG
jgi:hypothetical protein